MKTVAKLEDRNQEGGRERRHTGKVNIGSVADAGDADRRDLNDQGGENSCEHVSLSQRDSFRSILTVRRGG